ncbi:MAG: hypothetical protein ACRDAQ_06590 [Cetobacterium sp.]
MNKKIKLLILLLLNCILSTFIFAQKNRNVIKAYEKGKPAKMNIEVTKVRSDNFVDFFIDKNSKKIYRDITKRTREVEDLDKKLYVTTYLKPSNKTNTINDELEHKITYSNGKRYLEISYSKEPEKIYLWVVKNDKVEKLYTGILKNIVTNNVGRSIDFNLYSKVLSNNNNFVANFQKVSNNSSNYSTSQNLHAKSGTPLNEWIGAKNRSLLIRFKLKDANDIVTTIEKSAELSNYNGIAEFDLPQFHFKYVNTDTTLALNLSVKNYNYKEIVIEQIYYAGGIGSSVKGTDTLTINYAHFNISVTDLDFGEFPKNKGSVAYSSIKVISPANFDFVLSIPKNTYPIYNKADNNILISVTAELLDETTIKGVIQSPDSGKEYVEGSYSGTIPLNITLYPKQTGGRF